MNKKTFGDDAEPTKKHASEADSLGNGGSDGMDQAVGGKKPFNWKLLLIVVLALAAVIGIVVWASVGGKKNGEGDTTEDGPQYEENSPLNNLPDADMNRDIVVLSGGSCNDWLIEDSGEPIGYAKYKRTALHRNMPHWRWRGA